MRWSKQQSTAASQRIDQANQSKSFYLRHGLNSNWKPPARLGIEILPTALELGRLRGSGVLATRSISAAARAMSKLRVLTVAVAIHTMLLFVSNVGSRRGGPDANAVNTKQTRPLTALVVGTTAVGKRNCISRVVEQGASSSASGCALAIALLLVQKSVGSP
jgi:hypothetical protein